MCRWSIPRPRRSLLTCTSWKWRSPRVWQSWRRWCDEKLLSEVCTIQYGFPFDSAKFSDSNGMPLIRIRDVVRGYSETYTTEEYKSEYIVHENDLLIGMDGEFNIAKWGKTPALLNQRVCRLAPKDSIDKDYLFYFMPIALKRIEEKTPFVTVKHLSAKELNKIEIPVLSLEEQRKIAETLSKVDKLIAFRDQQLAKLDETGKGAICGDVWRLGCRR
ncbi:MAG: restriction endonuclease subunit S [Faecalibacterium sp.]